MAISSVIRELEIFDSKPLVEVPRTAAQAVKIYTEIRAVDVGELPPNEFDKFLERSLGEHPLATSLLVQELFPRSKGELKRPQDYVAQVYRFGMLPIM